MASWEDDESLYGGAGGGTYVDPRSGKRYALVDYTFRGKRKRMWGGRRLKKSTEVVEVDPEDKSTLDELEQFRDERTGSYIRGRKGLGAYQGPGKAVVDAEGFRVGRLSDRASTVGFGLGSGGKYRKTTISPTTQKFIDYLKGTANWWDTERASGQRGQERKALLKAREQGLEMMRRESAEGRGWGRLPQR